MLDLIMRGELEQGHRLYPERLAERFGVSITPVREALMQLAAEGFIEVVQRRGYHVRTPAAGQIIDLWQVRQGLELTAGEICIARLKAGELQLRQLAPERLELDAQVERGGEEHVAGDAADGLEEQRAGHRRPLVREISVA